ncbi:MAG: sulfatase-like hydrolase/transferase [Anaerolineae bacterium]|nr:sulfatase-like hydrolase/transferase [Anaerolineae bacterium]NPV09896.1 sulfatase-like hydrolase/transferase [Anaerolineae bacterium]
MVAWPPQAAKKLTPEPSRTRTNVIFILTDDQGIWASGCYGNPEIRTPNIDRLAATGVRFSNFFCTSPVCSPSRATLMTGRVPSRHGVHDWIREGNVPPNAVEYLQGQTTYTDVLAAHGYHCGISGKWHLGASQLQQHHFSHWYVHQSGGGPYHNAPMVRDGKLINEPGYVTNAITDDALAFLEARAGEEAPFYLSVHYTAPHSPWTGHPQDIVDSYDDCPFESCPQEPRHPWAIWLTDQNLGNRESLKGYFAAVTAMDADVGRILDRVEELSLRENTLIIFNSDNGFSCGHHGFWGKGNGTFPLNMYENSVKVPLIFSQPGRLPQGAVTEALTSGYDFAPTLLDYLGLPGMGDERLPGRSFVPALMGQEDPGHDSVVVFSEYGSTRMVRTREWKYVHRYPYGPHELYRLADDPDERANLAERAEHAGTVRELRQQLSQWFHRYVDPRLDGKALPVTGQGQLGLVGPGEEENAFAQGDG